LGSPYVRRPSDASSAAGRKQALAGLPDVFGNRREQMRQQADTEKDELYKQIGQLTVELDFLEKKSWPYRLKTGADGSTPNIRT
jgi:hypothetical protein